LGELGQLLLEAREEKALSIAEVEQDTKIRGVLIEALEEDDYEALPAGIYRKGLLRNYAQYLGLDLKEVMTLHGGEEEEEESQVTVAAAGFQPPTGMTISSWLFIDIFLGILIIASVVVVGTLAYNRWFPTSPLASTTPSREGSLASPVLQLAPTDTPSPTLTPTEIPSGRLQADVEIISRTWLEVAVDGEQAFRGLIEAGTNWSWFAEDSIAMHIGNAGGVLVTLNGQQLGTLGGQDEVVDVVWTWESLYATPEAIASGTPPPARPSGTPVITPTMLLTPSPAP